MDAMADVHPDGPKILTQDPQYSADDAGGDPDGRPNADAMAADVGDRLRVPEDDASRDGLAPRSRRRPAVHRPLVPDAHRAADPAASTTTRPEAPTSMTTTTSTCSTCCWRCSRGRSTSRRWSIWLATVLPGLILDVTTFPAREVVYWTVVVPAWNLYMLARRALVMAGFMMPKPEEVSLGLTTLGTQWARSASAAALDDPLGRPAGRLQVDEPSGRPPQPPTTGWTGASRATSFGTGRPT